jgi:SAM-dependent methyltransferase
MFFPDRPAAFAQARPVLAPGGRLVFNTWDTVDTHQFRRRLHAMPPAGNFRRIPPTFLTDIPHGYADPAQITADLTAGGLACESVDTITLRGTAEAAHVARGFCTGTPVRAEIEARGPRRDQRPDRVADAIPARRQPGHHHDDRARPRRAPARLTELTDRLLIFEERHLRPALPHCTRRDTSLGTDDRTQLFGTAQHRAHHRDHHRGSRAWTDPPLTNDAKSS